jgi:hypothetical protein
VRTVWLLRTGSCRRRSTKKPCRFHLLDVNAHLVGPSSCHVGCVEHPPELERTHQLAQVGIDRWWRGRCRGAAHRVFSVSAQGVQPGQISPLSPGLGRSYRGHAVYVGCGGDGPRCGGDKYGERCCGGRGVGRYAKKSQDCPGWKRRVELDARQMANQAGAGWRDGANATIGDGKDRARGRRCPVPGWQNGSRRGTSGTAALPAGRLIVAHVLAVQPG